MDEQPAWLEVYFGGPATSIVGDDVDVAVVTATEVSAIGDAKVTVSSRVGHETVPDDTPVDVLVGTTSLVEQRRIDAVVTATNADATKGGAWTIRARVSRTAAVTTLLSGGTDPAPDADVGLDASLIVDGDDVYLRLTGLAGDPVTFGWELRAQRQGF